MPCNAHVFDPVDAEDQEVIENPAGLLDVGRGLVGGKGLAHRARMAVEMGGGGGQLGEIGDDIVPNLVLDGIDAGDLQAAHAFEEIALGAGQIRQVLLVFDVRLHLDVVLGAPFPFPAEEVFAVQVGPHVSAEVGVDAVGLVEAERGGRARTAGRRRVMEEIVAR